MKLSDPNRTTIGIVMWRIVTFMWSWRDESSWSERKKQFHSEVKRGKSTIGPVNKAILLCSLCYGTDNDYGWLAAKRLDVWRNGAYHHFSVEAESRNSDVTRVHNDVDRCYPLRRAAGPLLLCPSRPFLSFSFSYSFSVRSSHFSLSLFSSPELHHRTLSV